MESNKHQFCWIRNECIIPHFMARAIEIKRSAKRHTHTILYFMFVCIVCFIPFFICFAVVSIFAINLYPGNHLDAIFFCFRRSTHKLLSSQRKKKYQIAVTNTFRNQLYWISAWIGLDANVRNTLPMMANFRIKMILKT